MKEPKTFAEARLDGTVERRKRLIDVAYALGRIDAAVESLREAHRAAAGALPALHDSVGSLVDADLAVKRARAKLQQALTRVPL